MSELSQLKDRIATEFAPQGRTLRNADDAVEDDLHSLEPDDDAVIREARYPRLKPALAGAALLCSAALLGAGVDAGPYILSAGLAVAALFGAGLLFSGRRRPARSTAIRKHAEATIDRRWQMAETSQLLSTIHEALGDIAMIRDPGGRIVQANAVFCRLTGWVEPQGKTCESLGLKFEPRAGVRHYGVRIETPLGTRIFDWHDVLARDSSTGAFLLHSIARDVTEDSRLALETEAARQRAEAASQAKSRLLATVSHEIRTPLSGILGMSHLIGQTRLTSEQKNYLAGMRQSGHALVQLVDDLLDFSSIEAGRFQLRPTQEPLREVIESVVEMLAHRAHEKGIEIGATVAADVPGLLEFDAARLRQVLFNVVGNAVKFTHQGGVLVSVDVDRTSVVVRVKDSGPGMSATEQARVFDEFEQAGGAAQRSAGTGLGLAISRRIMDAFGGTLSLDSVPDEGTQFEIRFPVVGGDLETAARTRQGALSGSHVLVLAPRGPASTALAATIATLGGTCACATTLDDAKAAALLAISGKAPLTDIIVDHRHAALFRRLLQAVPALDALPLRRTYLVNPEERNGRQINQMDGYQAWLIRPLRERSLVEVLRGRMKGMEVRDAINDNRPVLRDMPALPQKVQAGGILLAEDDPVNAFMVRSILEKAGHEVRVVGDFAALETAAFPASGATTQAPGLIVTDFNMPGGDGTTVLHRLRAEGYPGKNRIPVIVLTSDTRPETRTALLAAGADAVLSKPADPNRLTAEIDRLLEV